MAEVKSCITRGKAAIIKTSKFRSFFAVQTWGVAQAIAQYFAGPWR